MKEKIKKLEKYITRILQYVGNNTYEEFSRNIEMQDACCFNLAQIGELVSTIDETELEKYDKINWKAVKGMRNKIVHDYDGVNMRIIWDTIIKDLPVLKRELTDL